MNETNRRSVAPSHILMEEVPRWRGKPARPELLLRIQQRDICRRNRIDKRAMSAWGCGRETETLVCMHLNYTRWWWNVNGEWDTSSFAFFWIPTEAHTRADLSHGEEDGTWKSDSRICVTAMQNMQRIRARGTRISRAYNMSYFCLKRRHTITSAL